MAAGELAAALGGGAGRPVLLDVRWTLAGGADRAAYEAGHLPDARLVDLDRDLAAPPGSGGRHPLPPVEVFEAAMRRCGVSHDSDVVVYDDAPAGMAAARCWWLLRWAGHRAVRVLDGGWSAWVAAGLPVEAGPVGAAPGDFTARPGAMPVLDADGAARVAREGVLLDARAPERFRGEIEPVDPVAGHIPGAVNAPPGSAVDVPAGAPVGAYCGSGVTASRLVLDLEARGIAAALYPGSWSEWIGDPGRPVATGA